MKFRALDSRGLPAEGAPVSFSLQSASPGVTLSPELSQTNKGSGEVLTQIIASSRVSSVVMVANSGDKVAQSKPISVAGSDGSDRGITFQCGETNGDASGGIHALMAYGPGRDLIAGVKLSCTAHVSDRNGDGVPNALVSFLTEAGAIGPSETTVADVIGNANVLYKTSYPLPRTWSRQLHPEPRRRPDHIGEYLAPRGCTRWTGRATRWRAPDPACPTVCEPRRADRSAPAGPTTRATTSSP